MLSKEANRKLTKKQLSELKARLKSERQKLIFNGVYLSEDFNLDDEDRSDDVDLANAAVSSASRLRFRNREVFYAKKIDESLARIEDGEYGECTDCGANIGYRRLSARPTANLCIICKEENERVENSSIFGRKSKSFDVKKASLAH